MNSHEKSEALFSMAPGLPAGDIPLNELVTQTYGSAPPEVKHHMLSQLVGKVFELAMPSLRSRLLEQLLQPLGALSLMYIAEGIFAKMRFRGGWESMRVLPEDTQNVHESDVIALVDHVQQVSVAALDGLAQVLSTSPLMASSAAAAVLVTLLMNRSLARRSSDSGLDGPLMTLS